MIDLSYLSKARDTLQNRTAGLVDTIRKRSPNRFTPENASQDNSWEGRWLAQDQERQKQLGWLESALGSGDLTKTTNRIAETQQAAQENQASRQHRTAQGDTSAGVARSGLAGSSQHEQEKARLDVALQSAKVQAKSQADSLRAAGIAGTEQMERQLVDQIMQDNGFYQNAQQAAATGQQVNVQAAQQQAQLDNQYRGILANAIGQFTQSTVSPIINEGFNSADRYNQWADTQRNRAYDDWRFNGRNGSFDSYARNNNVPTQNRNWYTY